MRRAIVSLLNAKIIAKLEKTFGAFGLIAAVDINTGLIFVF